MKARVYETDATYMGKEIHGVQIDIYDPREKEWGMSSFFPDDGCKPSDLVRKLQELFNYGYKIEYRRPGK